jgi:large subunit ribosomal protein L4
MIQAPVYTMEGEQIDTVSVDPDWLGGKPNLALIKQAIVMYQSNRRQGSAMTRSRSMVVGSTRKIYRQKGTGNARMGSVRSPVRRGGGVTFAKTPKSWRQKMPRKARRAARNSALLAKLLADEVLILDELKLESPKTKQMKAILAAVGADSSCTVGVESPNDVLVKSARNIPKVDLHLAQDLNARDILLRRKLVLTRNSINAWLEQAKGNGAGDESSAAPQESAGS